MESWDVHRRIYHQCLFNGTEILQIMGANPLRNTVYTTKLIHPEIICTKTMSDFLNLNQDK